jgi:hypothetical protein
MIDQKYLDIIERELDGTAEPEEIAALEAYVAGHPEARDYRQLAADLAAKLCAVPSISAPPDLRAEVLRSIGRGRPAEASRRRWWNSLPRQLANPASARIGLAFASGVVVGCLALAWAGGMLQSRTGIKGVTGSMLRGTCEECSTPPRERGIDLSAVDGIALATFADSSVLVEISLSGEGQSTLFLRSEDGVLHPSGYETVRGTPVSVLVEKDRVSATYTGACTARMRFLGDEAAGQPLRLEVSTPRGKYEGWIKATASGGSRP